MYEQHTREWYHARELGIPSRYDGATLTGRETTATREMALYIANDMELGRALVLLGNAGRGKTFAACAALLMLTEKRPGHPGGGWSGNRRFVGWHEFIEIVRPFDMTKEKGLALEWARQPGLIVLDEVRADGDQRVDSYTDDVISYREGNRFPTIITSNVPPDDLRKPIGLGERIASRFGRSWATVVLCDGDDLRSEPA